LFTALLMTVAEIWPYTYSLSK